MEKGKSNLQLWQSLIGKVGEKRKVTEFCVHCGVMVKVEGKELNYLISKYTE